MTIQRETRRNARATHPITSVILAGVAGALVVSAGAHDEDWRKLADRGQPFVGPVVRLDDGPIARGTFPSSGITLQSWIPLNNFTGGQGSGNDCWGYVSPSGREYAIMGLEKGFAFVEITNPGNATIVDQVTGPTSLWHDVKVIGEYAYGVSEGGSGIQVMDLSDIDNGNASLVRNFSSGGHSSTHNIVSNPDAGTLYLVGANLGNGGLIWLDLNDPTRPTVSTGYTEIYVHDAQVVTYTEGPFAGREIAFCAGGIGSGFTNTGLRIVDVTDKQNIFLVSTLFYSNAGYSHQCWLSDDKQYLYLNDELDEQSGFVSTTTTRIIDVSNINNPVNAGTFTTGLPAADHNLYTRNQYIFETNYTTGLRIFDASNPLSPTEVAFFDTRPETNSNSFQGAWSNYPYFPSGTVIVSDLERGLFVLSLDNIDFDRLLMSVPATPDVIDPAGTTIQVQIEEDGLTVDPATVVLFVNSSSGGLQSVPTTPTATPGLYEATTPVLPCDDTVAYYFFAQSTTGESFTAPAGAPSNTLNAVVATGQTTSFSDNFQTNQGWAVSGNISGTTAGVWQRGNPAGDGDRGDPSVDGDGSGQCYLTGNAAGNTDVDGGTTILTSPAMDATGGQASINYDRWYSNTFGGAPEEDVFVVEVSNNNGGTWTNLETVGPAGPEVSGGWISKSFLINDVFATPSAQFRIRFSASDLGSGSVVEAGVDGISVTVSDCVDPPDCPADLGAPMGVLDFFDVLAFLDLFDQQDPIADFGEPFGVFDFFDVLAYLAAFDAGCP